MNKELFVSSTPHETKVGLVEDDLLAEIDRRSKSGIGDAASNVERFILQIGQLR